MECTQLNQPKAKAKAGKSVLPADKQSGAKTKVVVKTAPGSERDMNDAELAAELFTSSATSLKVATANPCTLVLL